MVFGGCLVFILAIIILLIFKQPQVKGKCGEFFVAFFLNNMLDKNEYHVFNDVIIPDNAGGTTQIDHLVLSAYGIFVIETKNMNGWIFGDRNDAEWTQQIYHRKERFQNPFRQNYKHIVCLADMLNIPPDVMNHVIVFVGLNTIKTRNKLPDALVTNIRELIAYIKTFYQPVLSPSLVEQLQEILNQQRLNNTQTNRRKHVEYVQTIVNFPNANNVMICQACGSHMVLRTATRGKNSGKKFWGCSRYPQCKYTVNVK